MTPLPRRVALITGVNGITGNALVEHLTRQPRTEWWRIVITSRSPLKFLWQDPRIESVTVDFLAPIYTVIAEIAPVCHDVTHAFFAAYAHSDDFGELPRLNVPLFENFLTSLEAVAGSVLQRVTLQTGGKHYGGHLGPLEVPSLEHHPRRTEDSSNFYYAQEDFLFARHKQAVAEIRHWSYNIIRPHAIIGFAPGSNGMSEAITLAVYFICCRETGETPRFPGNQFYYNCPADCSSAEGVADLTVWAATQELTRNEAFNHCNGDIFVWRYLFPRLGAYFGLDVPETEHSVAQGQADRVAYEFKMSDWALKNRSVWQAVCARDGGNPNALGWGSWGYMDWGLGKSWPTVTSVAKARKYGWTRYDDTYETFVSAFRTLENVGVLPQRRRPVSQDQLGKGEE